MHPIQQKILNLAKRMDISHLSFRKLGKLIEESHPQKIKHHLDQLVKKGFISKDQKLGIKILDKEQRKKDFFSLPILGVATCGPTSFIAQEEIEGYLQISDAMLSRKNSQNLFVIKASGDSLNRAKGTEGGTIEDGDFVVIDGGNRSPKNGDYILSIIDDMANLKRFYQNKKTGEISLVSESTLNIAPIYIHPSDFSNYMVNGVVVRVIKKPKIK